MDQPSTASHTGQRSNTRHARQRRWRWAKIGQRACVPGFIIVGGLRVIFDHPAYDASWLQFEPRRQRAVAVDNPPIGIDCIDWPIAAVQQLCQRINI
jgi:hypothetical protein